MAVRGRQKSKAPTLPFPGVPGEVHDIQPPKGSGTRRRFAGVLLSVAFCLLHTTSPCLAAPSQQDVFKSIQQSVGEKTSFDFGPVILLAGGGGVILLVVVFLNHRANKPPAPKTVNHAGKLLKQIMRDLPLKSSELKQLKLLADAIRHDLPEEVGPLTMLLCPSLMGQGLRAAPPKLDRKKLAQIVRKLKRDSDG